MNYLEMVACYGRDSGTTNDKVDQAYELLMKRLGNSPEADMLRQSQNAWRDYQSKYCNFVAAANKGGSIVQLTRYLCYAEAAKLRLRELEGQINCPEGTAGCFPQH